METPEHQELRSRQRVSGRAIVWAALTAGAITFIFSGGTPWSSTGTMNAAMGRAFPINFVLLGILHFALALIYAAALARACYRFTLVPAIFIGLLTGAVLYGVNFVAFQAGGVEGKVPEIRVLITHLTFALFATVVYKGASVPKPRMDAGDRAPQVPEGNLVHREK